jgi:hypothetical protein
MPLRTKAATVWAQCVFAAIVASKLAGFPMRFGSVDVRALTLWATTFHAWGLSERRLASQETGYLGRMRLRLRLRDRARLRNAFRSVRLAYRSQRIRLSPRTHVRDQRAATVRHKRDRSLAELLWRVVSLASVRRTLRSASACARWCSTIAAVFVCGPIVIRIAPICCEPMPDRRGCFLGLQPDAPNCQAAAASDRRCAKRRRYTDRPASMR